MNPEFTTRFDGWTRRESLPLLSYLFAFGTRFGGHALYVKDKRLHYVNSFVGADEQQAGKGELGDRQPVAEPAMTTTPTPAPAGVLQPFTKLARQNL